MKPTLDLNKKRLRMFTHSVKVISKRKALFILFAAVLPLVSFFGAFYAGKMNSSRSTPLQNSAQSRIGEGLAPEVFENLEIKGEEGLCKGNYTVIVPEHSRSKDLQELCTVGPESSVNLKANGTSTSSFAPTDQVVPCFGDGLSGRRVQALYVVADDRADRHEELIPFIRGWAGYVDNVVNNSAQKTGGQAHVKWVTNENCELDVQKVVIPAGADSNFGSTVAAVRDSGYVEKTRKYLMWVDANYLCGIANMSLDDRGDPLNFSNGGPHYGRVDRICWGLGVSAELHELFHNLGAVQDSTPNATGRGHCTDEYEVMCYDDGAGVQTVCRNGHDALLDCNNNDYFSSAPDPGSYLDTHWNVFNSAYIFSQADEDGEPPSVPDGLQAEFDGEKVHLTWNPSTDDISTEITYSVYRRPPGGSALWENIGSSIVPMYDDYYVVKGEGYRYAVTAVDEARNSSERSDNVLISVPEDDNSEPVDRTPPLPAYNLNASNITTNGFTLNWTLPDGGSDIEKIKVYLYESEQATFYDDRSSFSYCCSLLPNTRYTAKVRVYDAANNSAISDTISVTTSNTPAPPSNSLTAHSLKHAYTNGSRVAVTAVIDYVPDYNTEFRLYHIRSIGATTAYSLYGSPTSTPKTHTFEVRSVKPQEITGFYIATYQNGVEAARSDTLNYAYSGSPETNAPPVPDGFYTELTNPNILMIKFNQALDDSGYVLHHHYSVTGPGYSKNSYGAAWNNYWITVGSLASGETYTIQVRAEDIWGNLSAYSSGFNFVMP